MKKQFLQLMRRGLFAALVLCGFVHAVNASTNLPMTSILDGESGIYMEGSLPFSELPPSGDFPVRIKIINRTNQTHTWQVKFASETHGANGLGMNYSTSLTVGGGQARDWDLLVPRPGLNIQAGVYTSLFATVEGYGIKGSGRFHVPLNASMGYANTNFVAMSESLGTAVWSKIEAQLKSGTTATAGYSELLTSRNIGSSRSGPRDLNGSMVKFEEMPPDWRAFSGISGLWLSQQDWETLSSDRRRAIRHWVNAGGHLFVASAADTIGRLPLLPPNLTTGKKDALGFGWITAVKLVNGELSPGETARQIVDLDSVPLPAWQKEYWEKWNLADYVGWPRLNVPLVLAFVVLFATVIGPINLRWLAPQQKRARLFLTVPLLSVGASIVLLGVIAFGDGFGGIGGRNALLYMPAEENQVTLLQEQIARSRLLFGRSFKLPETLQVSFATQNRQTDNGLVLERAGNELSGDWFRSRSQQTHLLRASIPSRAGVSLRPGAGNDAPPVLLSSVSSPLRELHYIDAAGRYWSAENAETGRPVTLTSSSRKALDETLRKVTEDLSINFKTIVGEVAHRPGHFYAVADAMPEAPVETLSSIRWNRQTIFCVGTCTGAESK